ncbi:hypothetical protein BHM03_00036663 [Ensete ventricosum]|nr:hypothetical protein BHM03_00036663 [Ensete ventricosum]
METKTAQKEEGSRDHCVPNVELIDGHPPKVGLETPELIASAGEAACVRCPTRQQRLGVVASGRFYDDASYHN